MKKVILIPGLLISFLTLIILVNLNSNSIEERKKEIVSNTILPINGFIGIEKGEVLPLNLTYFYSEGEKDLFEEIMSIKINDIDIIQLKGFKVKGNGHLSHYSIKTLVLDISGKELGKTEVTKITIQTANEIKEYKIGKLVFNVIEKSDLSPLLIGDTYPVIRDKGNTYLYSFNNSGHKPIEIRKIFAEIDNQEILNIRNKIIMKPKQKFDGEIVYQLSSQNKQFPISIIRPIIYYNVGTNVKYLLPPPTWYGLIGVTMEQLKMAIEFNKQVND